MRLTGLVLIIAATLVPIVWYAPLAGGRDVVALFSQYLGSSALILMGINQFIATRAPGLELVFGPLDRIYVLHKWLGLIALVAMGLHDIIDAEMNGLQSGPLSGIAEDVGEVSLYGLMILILASVVTFIPYHLWKWSHRIIGVFFILGAFHFFFIEKPFANSDPLGIYISSFCILGIVSYIWASLARPLAPRRHQYTVSLVRHVGDLTEVELTPEGQGLRHKPGQFAFLSIQDEALTEEHPFTLSRAPADDRVLRFSIKNLGNYTDRLRQKVAVGMKAAVSGPFGHFTMPTGRNPQIWIGAGVGITPFLAFAESLRDKQTGPVKLYYCVRERDHVAYASDLEKIAEEVPNLELIIVNSHQGARLSPQRILADLGDDVQSAHVFFCGPVKMRKALKSALVLKGLRASRFHFEEFEMRTGIGLDALAAWLWDRGSHELEKRRAAAAKTAE